MNLNNILLNKCLEVIFIVLLLHRIVINCAFDVILVINKFLEIIATLFY